MNAAQQFFDEVLDGFASMARGWGSTPSVLSAAAASVLSVDGAGISLIDDALRVPLGASSDAVRVAEQLQVTVGDGPCLSAAAGREPLVADAETMASRWPVYAIELAERTPFWSVASVPLYDRPGHVFGAVDLYGTRPVPPSDFDLDAAAAVAAEMARFLTGDLCRLGGTVDDGLDGWLDLPSAAERLEVWTAVGMVMGEFEEGDSAALDRLRGYAFANGVTLDQLARNVLERLVPLTGLHH
jgi:hypothetical protein